MQLMAKPQRWPFLYTWVVILGIVFASYAVTALTNPAPASANLTHWYMARSAGMTAYLLLSLTAFLGATTTSGVWDRLKLRKLVTQLHQFSAMLVLPFLFFHLWGLYEDKTVPFSISSLFVPFADTYRPAAVALGILSLYTWVLLVITSYFRERLNAAVWRRVHVLAFPMFAAVTLHGLLAGSDTHTGWAKLVYAVPSALVLAASIARWRKAKSKTSRQPSAA
ncbi:ferric reductase-like transmembrane domain-containing protein [Alicyclobacillus sendaiensis]|uniref:Ferric reductase-like transmembrane domain-containing protein n=1 Tax=Alicyclobacillus sendaiensis PA2 TaxID=3029425 RepID=A0ABT6XVG7_ALISE|nr:ferric reductase-like transmembrane domain-containing protein [Alicyclobacillus sendaiensis]MDI9258997.1 ferric reductase-like transmembrane domain-containing protein [Alicyclobacillus sendaiensis PA2]